MLEMPGSVDFERNGFPSRHCDVIPESEEMDTDSSDCEHEEEEVVEEEEEEEGLGGGWCESSGQVQLVSKDNGAIWVEGNPGRNARAQHQTSADHRSHRRRHQCD